MELGGRGSLKKTTVYSQLATTLIAGSQITNICSDRLTIKDTPIDTPLAAG